VITPFLSKTSSASGSVGPFASSMISLALTLDAFFFVNAFSNAPGTKTFTSRTNNSSLEIFLAPSKIN